MELKELKKFGYKEKLIYDTKVEVLEGGRRVTTETPKEVIEKLIPYLMDCLEEI